MLPYFLPSTALYISALIAGFVSLTASAAEPAESDEWTPASTRLHLDSSLTNLHQASIAPSGYSRTEKDYFEQGQDTLDISEDNYHDNHDFTKCHHRKELLSNYSGASSAFIECAVINAKPVLYCGHCVFEFELSKKAWHDIKNDEDCNEDILVSDKLQIVSQTQTFLGQLWHDGYCQKCYDEKQNFSPTNATLDFIQKYNDTMTCFMDHGGTSDLPVPVGSNVTLCSNCSKEYMKLNDLYNNLRDDQLCMDIIDLMNRTRIQWKDSECVKADKEFVSVVALSVFVCVLPFFFYLTAMIHGQKKQQRLVQKSKNTSQRGLSASARLYAGTTTSLR